MSAQVRAPAHPLAPWLRARVLDLRTSTRRRLFPPSLELVAGGHLPTRPTASTAAPQPAGEPVAVSRYADLPPGLDHALRVDVLVRMLTDCGERGFRSVSAVHVRPGRHHEPSDADLGWLRAATGAAQVSGIEVVTVVALSRWGWQDLLTGAQRTWRRLRV